MTCGIYALYWEEPDLIYIGQSVNIEERNRSHLNKLKRSDHYNHKLQNAYDRYGEYSLRILDVCTANELDVKEAEYGDTFNCLDPKLGLNIVELGHNGGRGTNHGSSKYSRITVFRVFSLLYRTNLRIDDIAKKTRSNRCLATHIKSGIVHNWLKEEYPRQYSLMSNRFRNAPEQFTGGMSKFSKITVLRIFSLLYRTRMTNATIGLKTNVSEKLVSHIKNGTRHLWVHEEYPLISTLVKNRAQGRSKN